MHACIGAHSWFQFSGVPLHAGEELDSLDGKHTIFGQVLHAGKHPRHAWYEKLRQNVTFKNTAMGD
jgi:cyclophilin family peptidyl-prolyl cis-trans isomerase